MKLHEYQAKEIFSKAGIPTPKGTIITSADQAEEAMKDISGPPWVV
jgi:succinyl-CoA synthetase beta subunit